MKINDAIDRYYQYIMVEKGLSLLSAKAYLEDIYQFIHLYKKVDDTRYELIEYAAGGAKADGDFTVDFDDIKVVRHGNPDPEYKRCYGVTLHQSYKSGTYSDEGYLFLLWDFTDENKPKIHVRTWQPDAYSKDGKTKERIAEDEIFSIADFEIFKVNE